MLGYDLKQAATYFLKDDKKILKLIVLYILAILNAILGNGKHISFYQLLSIIPALYFCGYMAKNTNCRMLKLDNNKLPELNDWQNYITIGFAYTVGILVYIIPIAIICGILMIPFAIIFIFSEFSLLKAIFCAFIMVVSLFIYSILIAVQIAFSTNLKFKSMFDFKLLKQIIFKNGKLLAKLVAVTIILAIVSAIVTGIFGKTLTILAPLVTVYLSLIVSDLYGQFINKAIKQNEG